MCSTHVAVEVEIGFEIVFATKFALYRWSHFVNAAKMVFKFVFSFVDLMAKRTDHLQRNKTLEDSIIGFIH